MKTVDLVIPVVRGANRHPFTAPGLGADLDQDQDYLDDSAGRTWPDVVGRR